MACYWGLLGEYINKIPPDDWLRTWGAAGCGNLNGLIIFLRGGQQLYISATPARHYPGRLLGGNDAWEKLLRWIKEDAVIAIRHIPAEAIQSLPSSYFYTVEEIDAAIAAAGQPYTPPPEQPGPPGQPPAKPAKITQRLWDWIQTGGGGPIPIKAVGPDGQAFYISATAFLSKADEVARILEWAEGETCKGITVFDQLDSTELNKPLAHTYASLTDACAKGQTPSEWYKSQTQISAAIQALLETWNGIVFAVIGLQSMGVDVESLLGEYWNDIKAFVANIVDEIRVYGEETVRNWLAKYVKDFEWLLWLKEWYETNQAKNPDEVCILSTVQTAATGAFQTKAALFEALNKCLPGAQQCTCTPWIRAELKNGYRHYVRTCTPKGCEAEERWEWEGPGGGPGEGGGGGGFDWRRFGQEMLKYAPWIIGGFAALLILAVIFRPRPPAPPVQRKITTVRYRRAR